MDRAELKEEAKEVLRGRWGTAIGMLLVYGLIEFVISFVAGLLPLIGSIVTILISIPFSFGLIGQWMKFTRKENVGMCDFVRLAFDNFGKSWSIYGNTLLKLLPYIIIPIISGFVLGILRGFVENYVIIVIISSLIIALFITMYIQLITESYYYSLTQFIGNDNLQMSGKEIVEESQKLMEGHRLELFVLEISFLGWILLSILTFGIGLLWVIPYMQITTIKFYEKLANNSGEGDTIINN